jgi:hypothetical protein
MTSNSLKITVSEGSKSMTFSVNIKLPSSGSAPYPAIITYGGASLPIPNTVATITYQNFEMAADKDADRVNSMTFMEVITMPVE